MEWNVAAVGETYRQGRPFVPVRSCDALASSTRVTRSQLGWLLLLLVVTFNQGHLLFGQTPPSARLHVYHDSWTFKDGAPADVTCLAQTSDGFLWLGGPNGLFRFDGTRFEPLRSPFGDRLLSTTFVFLVRAAVWRPLGGLRVRGLQFPEQWAGHQLCRRDCPLSSTRKCLRFCAGSGWNCMGRHS